jgi:hypothetical protein
MWSIDYLANSFDASRTAVPGLHPQPRLTAHSSQRAPSSKRAATLFAFLMALCFCAAPAKAQDYSHVRIVRLSFIEGNVQYQRPGEDWQDAKLNLPIEQGYALRTDDGYAEVEFETGLEMRLASNSSIEFTELALANGGLVTRLHVSAGTASVDAKLSKADQLSFSVSNFQVNVPHDGRFRIDTSAAESWVSVFHGKVAVQSASTPIMLGGGHAIHEAADDLASLQIEKGPPRDAFDKWVAQREEGLSDARADMSDALRSNSYSTGFADLDLYGGWASVPGYGWGWQPYGVAAGWVPFYSGQWMFMGNTGWNWVSSEPWGWLPYHFGAWVNAPGMGWMWVPQGPLAWQPATATWVQSGNQVGWTPVLATPLKPPKSASGQPAAPSRTLIVASPANGANIAPSRIVPIASANVAAAHVVVPVAPPHTLSSATGTASVNAAGNRPVTNSIAPAGQNFQRRAPATAAFPASRASSAFNSSRPLMQAPRTAPLPRVMSAGGSATGFNGVRGGGVSGMGGGVPAGVGRMGGGGRIAGGGGGARAGASAGHVSGGGGHASSGGGHR